jgi:hypothetical protein
MFAVVALAVYLEAKFLAAKGETLIDPQTSAKEKVVIHRGAIGLRKSDS